MAKTAKLKKSGKPPSQHSRASRRASSPSINLDKSLTSLKPPFRSNLNILAAQPSAGITKKKRGKILKRKQKQRIELGKEKAEAVIEKLEKKKEKAGGRRDGIKGRNTDWDELNEKIAAEKGKKKLSAKSGGGKNEGIGNGDIREGALPFEIEERACTLELPVDDDIILDEIS